ncbi:MAG: ASKHA domain-containing protein [Promethearchaeota archaeon]
MVEILVQKEEENFTIRFEPDGVIVRGVKKGATVLEIAMNAGVGIRSECGGKGTCKKCLIRPLKSDFLVPLDDQEKKLLGTKNSQLGLRLACKSIIQGSGTVVIIDEARIRSRKLQIEGVDKSTILDPVYSKILLSIPEPSLEDQRSDFSRISSAIQQVLSLNEVKINASLIQEHPKSFRESDWELILTIKEEQEIIEILPKHTSDNVLGVAIDLGTSKIVAHLVDLTNGKTLAINAVENPQLPYGEDIISRIKFATASADNLNILKEKVVSTINNQILQMLKTQERLENDVYAITLAGNTCMQHLFLGADPEFLSRSPYVPVFTESLEVTGRFSGIRMNPAGSVTIFPSIGGFIGGDCVAMVLSTSIDRSKDLCLGIDVGTNTEVVIGNQERMTATSCASGPAFEGYHVQYGMKAVDGAIEHLKIDSETYNVDYDVIGDIKPTGLCGSAMIDCLAELMKSGLVDNRGMINRDLNDSRLVGEKRNRAFVIVTAEETVTGKPLLFTQEDIRSIQLAKGAILTGCLLLMKTTGTDEQSIRHVYLAGAFGNQVNLKNARMIGLLPEFPLKIMEFVGNTAVTGAKQALLSREDLKRAKEIAKKTEYLELALDKQFQQEFAKAMYLPYEDMTKFPSVLKELKRNN